MPPVAGVNTLVALQIHLITESFQAQRTAEGLVRAGTGVGLARQGVREHQVAGGANERTVAGQESPCHLDDARLGVIGRLKTKDEFTELVGAVRIHARV